jgi:hypothetical protein
MATKTDRILSYLPGTFRALPKPTVIYSTVDAFGNELLQAENTLAAVIRSHWVDTADKNEDVIVDLKSIASLYGLSSRDDETVEDFRAHLKHYVRTFLDGTPTVQGILRVAAEALGLVTADSYDQLDTWWNRKPDALTTIENRGDDASGMLFSALQARGSDATAASFVGTLDLSAGVDLRNASVLSLKIDGNATATFDLAPMVGDPSKAPLNKIIDAINNNSAARASAPDGAHLVIASPTVGASSKLALQDVANDAATVLLGLAPRSYSGSGATSAGVRGTVDLAAGTDLSDLRYVRIAIDGKPPVEIDCAGPTPSATTLQNIVDAINAALGPGIASHDGHSLFLQSSVSGFSSSIQFLSPTAQDATQKLFGKVSAISTGKNPQPAQVTGSQNLSKGADLTKKFNVSIALDGAAPLVINCAGAVPGATSLAEIVSKINAGIGKPIASPFKNSLNLISPTQGSASSIVFSTSPTADATYEIFGIPSREAAGNEATAASLAGNTLPATLNFGAQHLLQIAVDDDDPTSVDFWGALSNRSSASLGDVATAINNALGANAASPAGDHLVITSATKGAASSIVISPLTTKRTKRYVTRAFVTGEAAETVLGVAYQKSNGTARSPARVEGTAELSRGVDLRTDPFLQFSIDGAPPLTVDCSQGLPRPRVALPGEISAAINREIDAALGTPGKSHIASDDGHHLFFTSPTSGASSSIQILSSYSTDAASLLGLQYGDVFGHDAVGVSFQGTVDLSAGLDLSSVSKVKLAIDGAAPVEIDCAGQNPSQTSQAEIITRINTALNATIAAPNGKFMSLTSPTKGANSKIEILAPSASDATLKILGVGPRKYHGLDVVNARIVGTKDLSAPQDLTNSRFLLLTVDSKPALDIDCSATANSPAQCSLADIIKAINGATKQTIASSPDNKTLVLSSPTTGVSGEIALQPYPSDGAFTRLMGNAAKVTKGADAAPAVINGTVDLLAGANLDERRTVRIALDNGSPVDIDISGAKPSLTFLDEIRVKINDLLGPVASASSDDHLILSSLTRGENSSIEVLPIRALELCEYTPTEMSQSFTLKHGDTFSLHNSGASASSLCIELSAPQGLAGVTFINRTAQRSIRVMELIPVGGTMILESGEQFLPTLKILDSAGNSVLVSASSIEAGPLGARVAVPFVGPWHLIGGSEDTWAALQLNDPQAPNLLLIRARTRGPNGDGISITAVQASLAQSPAPTAYGSFATLAGRLHKKDAAFQLLNADNSVLAILRRGSSSGFDSFADAPVIIRGNLYFNGANPPILAAQSVAALFDVTILNVDPSGTATTETYAAVSIGMGLDQPESLAAQILSKPSQAVVAEEIGKTYGFELSRGLSKWNFLVCDGARFDSAVFDAARFAGGLCFEPGVFDASRFANSPPESEAAVFAGDPSTTTANIKFRWLSHQPGSFVVNLPADLPEKFGARFDQALFGSDGAAPESFPSIVMEPSTDLDYLETRIKGHSSLVMASTVDRVPIGWAPSTIPFHHPRARNLTGGTDTSPAAIYLSEPGVPKFIKLTAKNAGTWGNAIEVSAVKVSPGRFDVTVGYQAASFESARETVFAGKVLSAGEDPLPPLTGLLLKPRPVGVLQGKAAGVLAKVARERAWSNQ